jgi:hypothetical protein
MGPRDPVYREPSERQAHHLDAIQTAGEALYEAMHFAEGSQPPGEHQDHEFQSPRMRVAAQQLEIALMLARRSALEAR